PADSVARSVALRVVVRGRVQGVFFRDSCAREARSAFFRQLGTDGRAGDVVLMTYSEFGRRVAANASGGTDHGTAGPVFVAGPHVKGGFYGDEPSLTDLDQGDLRFTTDFRSIYATMLGQVIGVDPAVSLAKGFAPLAFL